jgi:hypothetical protein
MQTRRCTRSNRNLPLMLFTDINLGNGMNGSEPAARKGLGNYRRHSENPSPSSGNDLGETVSIQRPAGARARRAGDVITLAVLVRFSPIRCGGAVVDRHRVGALREMP